MGALGVTALLGLSLHVRGHYRERHRRLAAWLERTPRRDEIAKNAWRALWGNVDPGAFTFDLLAFEGSHPRQKRPRANPAVMAKKRVRQSIPFVPGEKQAELFGESLLDLSPQARAPRVARVR